MQKFLLIFPIFLFLFGAPQISAFENKNVNRPRTVDIEHYTIRLNFDRRTKTVFGDSTVRFLPLSENFKTLELDANNLKFESVKLEPAGTDLIYKTLGDKIFVTLDKSYGRGDVISVRFKYAAQPKKGIYFVGEQKSRGKIIRHQQIWTQGEAEETHHWLPSFDFPDEKATTEQFITARTGETVIANGELLETIDNKNGTQTFHYKMPVPHSLYLTSFIVGTYEKILDKYKEIPLGFYVYPGQKPLVQKAYGKTKDMFRIFEDLTGVDYPFNKYDQTMVAEFKFGGMENITATTMADSEIMMAKFPLTRGLVEDLVAHELAHSWFGNLVTCRNWAELWLNEGFATFMEAAFREKMYGRRAYVEKIESDATEFFTYVSIREDFQHALFNTKADADRDETMFTPITYQKGGVVIHMLRAEVGDEIFWRAVNEYLRRFRFKNVETADLQKVFEDVSGRNLDWFFKQWIFETGYPKLQIEQIYKQNSNELVLKILQTQAVGKNLEQIFTLPLEIEIQTAAGKHSEKILVKNKLEEFTIPTKSLPQIVRIDKDYKIPLKDVELKKLSVVR